MGPLLSHQGNHDLWEHSLPALLDFQSGTCKNAREARDYVCAYSRLFEAGTIG